MEKLPETISHVRYRVGFKNGAKVEVSARSGEMGDLFFRLTCNIADIISNTTDNLSQER